MHMFKQQGHHPSPVDLQVSFGKDQHFWTNVFPTQLVEKHQAEIKRFSWALKVVRWFEVFFAVLPIRLFLKIFMFSEDFGNYMILPTVALFLGMSLAFGFIARLTLSAQEPATIPPTFQQSSWKDCSPVPRMECVSKSILNGLRHNQQS